MGSLFVRRRRIWVRVRPQAESGSEIEVAGLDRTGAERLAEEVAAIAGELRKRVSVTKPPADHETPEPRHQEQQR